jgi:hypothetical protein
MQEYMMVVCLEGGKREAAGVDSSFSLMAVQLTSREEVMAVVWRGTNISSGLWFPCFWGM